MAKTATASWQREADLLGAFSPGPRPRPPRPRPRPAGNGRLKKGEGAECACARSGPPWRSPLSRLWKPAPCASAVKDSSAPPLARGSAVTIGLPPASGEVGTSAAAYACPRPGKGFWSQRCLPVPAGWPFESSSGDLEGWGAASPPTHSALGVRWLSVLPPSVPKPGRLLGCALPRRPPWERFSPAEAGRRLISPPPAHQG
nr:uncharacterized protein LOC123289326 [Equus asinus]